MGPIGSHCWPLKGRPTFPAAPPRRIKAVGRCLSVLAIMAAGCDDPFIPPLAKVDICADLEHGIVQARDLGERRRLERALDDGCLGKGFADGDEDKKPSKDDGGGADGGIDQ